MLASLRRPIAWMLAIAVLGSACREITADPPVIAPPPPAATSEATTTPPAAAPAATPAIAGTEVFRCNFEGPYSVGANPILRGCTNNWEWGKKTIRLAADSASGRPGTVQRISIDDVQSGEMHFFVGPLPWLERGSFHRVSFWMRTEGLASLGVQVRKNDTIIYHGGLKMMIGFDRSPTPAVNRRR